MGAHIVFEQDLLTADNQRDEAELVLRRPLPDDELRLHFQPRWRSTPTGSSGWRHWSPGSIRSGGMVAPLEFIPLAEATGLIAPIGAWVIAEACHVAARWRCPFPDRPLLVVSVNVSVRQFRPGLDG